MNPFVLAAVIVTVIAFLLEMLCVALPFWLYYFDSTNNLHYYLGLFAVCPSINNDYHVCATSHNFPAFWIAMEVMEVFAFVTVIVAAMFGVVALTCKQYSGIVHIVAAILDICTAVFGLIAVIVFGAKYDDLGGMTTFNGYTLVNGSLDGENIHASFYLALFAVVFALVGAIFFFLGKPRAAVKSFN